MTDRRDRIVEPYTSNMDSAGFVESVPVLDKVLPDYFDNAGMHTEISTCIHEAVGIYNLTLKTNPTRKITRLQRNDRHELIECLKELDIRLDPEHIPTPLWNPVRSAYIAHQRGKATLNAEIADLLPRLRHIRKIFESNEIPVPSSTNPGKPERDHLVRRLAQIFDDFAKRDISYSPTSGTLPADYALIRREFVANVCEVFALEIHLPRLL